MLLFSKLESAYLSFRKLPINRVACFIVIVLFVFSPQVVKSQSNLSEANVLLDAEQLQYRIFLKDFQGNAGIDSLLKEFADHTTDSLQAAFNNRINNKESDKFLSINAIRYFLQLLRVGLEQQNFELYEVPDVWDKLDVLFSKSAFTRRLFEEYIPPYRNISLFV